MVTGDEYTPLFYHQVVAAPGVCTLQPEACTWWRDTTTIEYHITAYIMQNNLNYNILMGLAITP